MKLNELRDNPGAAKVGKRLGRGIGSGLGKTAGRGHKGQKARSGVAVKGFEGGQMPLHRRLPKRGFKNPSAVDYAELNLGKLQAAIDAKKLDIKSKIDADVLVAAGVVRRALAGVRLLGNGELKSKIDIVVHHATKSAAAAVAKAGGTLTVTEPAKGDDTPAQRKGQAKKSDGE